ncbi:acyl-CoA dehydrogenase family protein [Actinokineospora sp. HUAS TT18]|uniref:acyl-CoA dehydrogenase family protein n=1 Tax=Actinokineospora sp. HUAS TT18 TaxID=3447451 RepID=UPI003F51F60D
MTDERTALRDSVRSMLSRLSDSAAVRAAMGSDRGHDEDLWRKLCDDIGVAALGVPEEFGGLGAGVPETAVVLGELGRTLTPSPLLGTAVAAHAVLATGDTEAAARLLPGIAAGRVATLAWTGPDGAWDFEQPACAAELRRVTGTAHYVLDGDIADTVLVAARTGDGTGLFEVTPATAAATPTLDLTRRLATLAFDGQGTRIGGDATAALRHAKDVAHVLLAAEQAGAAARCLELTVAYSKQRIQFGRPIGSFQALKHRMADLYVLVETASAIAEAAAESLDLACAARAHCSEAFQTVAAEMIQLHGGIAITWEHDAHLYFKRAHGSARLFGPTSSRRLATR